MFDTFISYRRAGGSATAARVYDYLRLKGSAPFFDRTGMKGGRFDEQIKRHLLNCSNFVLILSPGALDRCSSDEDWVYREIGLALAYNLNIIVLKDEDFAFPTDLRPELEQLKLFQAVEFSEHTLSTRLELVYGLLLKKKTPKEVPDYGLGKSNRFRIRGEYITYYEDIEDGHVVIRRAPAVLKSFMGYISGRTWFGTRQAWRIRAHMYGHRRLAGVYFAESSIDDGIGTFFLNVLDGNTLEGYWSGYDNENCTLTTGKYIFKRKYTGYTIRKATVADFSGVIRIADAQLGEGYFTKERLQQAVDGETTDDILVAVQNSTGTVIAFSYYRQITHEEAKSLANGYPFRNLMFDDKLGYLATVATREGFQGLGVATALVQKSIENLKEQGVEHFISTAWKHSGVVNIGSVLENQGFRKETELPRYWYESSLQEGYLCPNCGNPCTCSCVIYTKI